MSKPIPAAKAWRPTPFVQASIATHVGAVTLAALSPAQWPWALGALVADHVLIGAAGLWPRSTWLGENMRRLPARAARNAAVWITIDDGPDPDVTPQILKILDTHGARASFFCIGQRVAQHASLAREIIAAGHSIENHSQHHFHRFSVLGPRGMRDEVLRAQDTIENITGRRPRYFRAPAGLRNPFLDYILHQEGLRLASWTRRGFDTREFNPDIVLQRLTKNLSAGDILLLHDGNASHTADKPAVSLSVLPRLLETLAAHKLQTFSALV